MGDCSKPTGGMTVKSPLKLTSRQVGKRWEKIAESFLRRHGLTTRKRNFSSRLGEIDLVMNDRNSLVFVEVRFRGNNRHGSGADTVTRQKQARIIRAAMYFLSQNPRLSQKPCRFDVISIGTDQGNHQIQWIKNAFETTPG